MPAFVNEVDAAQLQALRKAVIDRVAHRELELRHEHASFRDSLGMSPYQYILTQKLRAVRRQLRSSGVCVTDAAFTHGFYTPSRFARQYAQLFGELPSETRCRGARRGR